MKIVHLICTFSPYRSGMGHTAEEMVDRLVFARPDYEVMVVCPAYGQKAEPLTKSSYKIKRLSSWFSFGNAAILRDLRQVWRSADIVHFHYPFYGTDGLVWWLKTRYPKTKLVIHYHMDPQANGWRGWLFVAFRKLFLGRLLKQAEAVTCASLDYWQASAAGQLGLVSQDRLFETPFLVDIQRFQPRVKDGQLISQLGLQADWPVLLMVGGLDRPHYFKGVDILLRALAILKKNNPDLKLQAIIVGDGDLRPSYQLMANQLGLTKLFHLAGRVGSERLPDYYNLADLFVLPSINRCEAFGLVLLEAMASGLPCLASNLPGVRRVISAPQNGLLIEPNDAPDLARGILEIMTDKTRRLEMALASRRRAEQFFNAEQTSRLPEIYQSIIKYENNPS